MRSGGRAPPGAPDHLVASGMRPDEADDVAAAFAPLGLTPRDSTDEDGWSTVLLVRA